MIALDTNILLRLLTKDDPAQAEKAKNFYQREISQKRKSFITLITLVETVWVLKARYKRSKSEISMVINGLLYGEDMVVDRKESVEAALMRYQTGSADFSDYLIAEIALAQGAEYIATFDKKATKEPYYKLII